MKRLIVLSLFVAGITAAGLARAADEPKSAADQPKHRIFEMRTYYTVPGRLDALNARFRDHTCRLFQKHGMELVGFWTPHDEKDKLVYILAYPSREAAKASWDAFRADPDWKKAQTASEKDGKIVSRVESIFLDPTDYSGIR